MISYDQFILGKGARGLLASVEDLAKAEPSQFFLWKIDVQ